MSTTPLSYSPSDLTIALGAVHAKVIHHHADMALWPGRTLRIARLGQPVEVTSKDASWSSF
jgi:hypothetical protein